MPFDCCGGLIVLGIVLLVITVVGHGLWLLIAWMLRGGAPRDSAFRNSDRDDPDGVRGAPGFTEARVRCPRCSVVFGRARGQCPSCGLRPNSPIARELSDLETTARVLQQLLDAGGIDKSVAESVYQSLETRQQALLKPERPPGGVRTPDRIPSVIPVGEDAGAVGHRPPPLPVASPVPPPLPQPEPKPAPIPKPPRRSLGQVLAAFMEAKNILWGELVGGMLIVGCSIALVLSLWTRLEEQIHFFPFLVFAAVTAALFAAGRYSLTHWKLESTSRGLLVIATLLTPLDFAVLAGLARGRASGPLDWAIEAAALVVFALIIRWSAGVLLGGLKGEVRGGGWLAALAIVGASGSLVLVPRSLELENPSVPAVVALGLTPVVLQLLAVGPVLWVLARRSTVPTSFALPLLMALGQAAFATAVALGFLVYWSAEPLDTLRHLAIPVALTGLAPLMCGALLYGRLTPAGEEQPLLSPALARWAGTVVGGVGVVILLTSLALAWPRRPAMITLGLTDAVVLASLALLLRLHWVQIPAAICLAVAVLALLYPDADQPLHRWLVSPPARWAWLTLAVVSVFASEAFAWFSQRRHAAVHAGAAGIAALAAMALTLPDTTADARHGAIVFGVVWVGSWLTNLRWQRNWLTLVGSLVSLGFAGFVCRAALPEWETAPLLTLALLAAASVHFVVCWLLDRWRVFGKPIRDVAMLAALLAAIALAFSVQWDRLNHCAIAAGWMAAIWLGFTAKERRGETYLAAQLAMTAGVILAVANHLIGQPWFVPDWLDLIQPRSLQQFITALAVLGAVWAAARAYAIKKLSAGPSTVWERASFMGLLLAHVFLLIAWVAVHVSAEMRPNGEFTRYIPPLRDLPSRLTVITILGLLVCSCVFSIQVRLAHDGALGLLILFITMPLFAAAVFRDDAAVVPAVRWGLAIAYLAASFPVWFRRSLQASGQPKGAPATFWGRPRDARVVLILFAVLPVLGLTTWQAVDAFNNQPHLGPVRDSVFYWLGTPITTLVPLVLIVIGLAGLGISQHKPGYIFSAGQVAAFSAAGGYALSIVTSGGKLGTHETVTTILIGTLAAGLWGLIWRISQLRQHRGFQTVQGLIAALLGGFILAIAGASIVMDNRAPSIGLFYASVATPLGWCAWFAALGALIGGVRARVTAHAVAVSGLGVGVLAACAAETTWPGRWAGYHALTLGWALLALLLAAVGWRAEVATEIGPKLWTEDKRKRAADRLRQLFASRAVRGWVNVLAPIVVMLCLAGSQTDPHRRYFSTAGAGAVALLLGTMAAWRRNRVYAYLACFMVNVVAYLAWQAWLVERLGPFGYFAHGPGVTDRFLLLQVMAFAVSSILWSLVETGLRRRVPPIDLRGASLPVAHATVLTGLHLMALLAITGIASDFTQLQVHLPARWSWLALGSVVAAIVTQFWDPEAGDWGLPEPPLYVAGLLGLILYSHQQALPPHRLAVFLSVGACAYIVIVTGLVWGLLRGSALWRSWRLPAFADRRSAHWFFSSQATTAVAAMGLSLWIVTQFQDQRNRLIGGPLASGLLPIACFVLTKSRPRVTPFGPTTIAQLGIACTVSAFTELAWYSIAPDGSVPWLHRSARLLAVLVVAAGVVSSPIIGWLSPRAAWAGAACRARAPLAVLAAMILATVLVQEMFLYDREARTTPLAVSEMLLVCGLLAAAVVAAIYLALTQRIELSLPARKGCVWAAELIFGALLLHVRLNRPQVYHPFLGQHWHFTVLAVGLIAVVLGELFRRRGRAALADPLHTTGLLLPIIPVLAYTLRPVADMTWITDAVPGFIPLMDYLKRLPHDHTIHATLWFFLGGIYALIAVMRWTSGYALIGAVMGNFGLWVLLAHEPGNAFTLHPQLWLAPLGVLMLVAEMLHRPRLGREQAAGVRYVGALLIYVSSTADMFIAGLGNSVVLPIVLSLLSVAGIFVGILTRVRGLLFLGVAFLALVILSQIYHAAITREQKWVLWAFGIVLGAAILALFAVFEKRRNDVQALLARIREWEG